MSKLIPHSLKIKFSLSIAFILLFVFTFTSAVLINQNLSYLKQSLSDRAETFVELATKPLGRAYSLYHNSGILKLNDVVKQTMRLNNTIPRIQIISVGGDVLFDSKNVDSFARNTNQVKIVDSKILQAVEGSKTTKLKDDNGNISEIIVPYADDYGSRPFSLRYFISYSSIYNNLNQSVFTIIILNIILFLGTFLVVTLLINRSILSPLERIIKVAQSIEKGDLEQKIEVNTKDELEDLALSLNQMTTTLKKNIFELKNTDKLKDEFIAIASHNLRTPLSVINGFIPVLKQKNLDEEVRKITDSIEESTQKLITISESLINIASFEKTTKPMNKRSENIVNLIQEVIKDYQSMAEKKNIKFNVIFPDSSITVAVDKERLKQAISHVIDNAIKFNKANGQISISLTALDNEILLSVSDTGIGISPDEVKNIFQRFHRGTSLLTYNFEGIGLGLYISKIIIEAHLGRIWVTSNVGQGTNVYISLPTQA